MSVVTSGEVPRVGRGRFFDTLRAILFLAWCQTQGRSFFKFYLLPLVGAFGVSYFLALEPTSASFESWMEGLFLLTALPLIALTISGGMIRDEIKDSTIEYLWTRPATRFQLIIGFYLAAVMKTVIYGLALVLSLYAAGFFKGCHPDFGTLPSVFLAILFSALTFCAGGLLFATLTGKYMIWGIVYGAVFELGIGSIPTNISKLSVKHYIERIAQIDSLPSLFTAFGSFAICLGIALVCLAGAVLVFSTKSYSLGQEKEG